MSLYNTNNLNEVRNSFENFKSHIVTKVNSKDKQIEELTEENKKLEKFNTNLKDKLLLYESEINKLRQCIHCNKNFTSKNNDDVYQINLEIMLLSSW